MKSWKALKRRSTSTTSPQERAVRRLDLAIESLVTLLLVFMPFALGVVAPWSEGVVHIGAIAIALCLVLKRFVAPVESPRLVRWSFVPIALFLLLIVVQLTPLPSWLIAHIAPGTLEVRTPLLNQVPEVSPPQADAAVTFYATGTRHDARVIVFAVVMFAAVIDVYRRRSQIKRLLTIISIIGGAVAALALAQDLSGTTLVYWSIQSPWKRAGSGPFFYYNNFGQFINLSIGAMLGLGLFKWSEAESDRSEESSNGEHWSIGSRITVSLLVLAIVMSVIALFASTSRGGMISLLIALPVTVVLIGRRRKLRGAAWGILLTVTIAFGGLLYVGFDAVAARLATLVEKADPTSGRLQTDSDIVDMVRQFPVLGTGLGTHELVYPMFDHSKDGHIAEYADSDWFQLAEETGLVGLALVLIFVGFIVRAYVQAVRARHPRLCIAAIGLGYGLLAVICHSVTDFGQHLPSVAALSAISCALLMNLARLAAETSRRAATPESSVSPHESAPREVALPDEAALDAPASERFRPLHWGVRLATPFMLLVVAGWAVLGAWQHWQASDAWTEAMAWAEIVDADGPDASDEDYSDLLISAEAAVAIEPENVRYQHGLNWYRWRSISRHVDPATQAAVIDQGSIGNARRIVGELRAAIPLCPTFGPLFTTAGQIELLVLDDHAVGVADIRTGYRLAPASSVACYAAGIADLSEQKWGASVEMFGRSAELANNDLSSALNLYLFRSEHPELSLQLANEKPEWLAQLINLLRQIREDRDNTQWDDLWARSVESIKAQASNWDDDTSGGCYACVAQLYDDDDDNGNASYFYRKALAKNYDQVYWRLQLASELGEQGQYDDAIREARLCLQLQPDLDAARRLIGDMNVKMASPVAGASPASAPSTEPAVVPQSQPISQPPLPQPSPPSSQSSTGA